MSYSQSGSVRSLEHDNASQFRHHHAGGRGLTQRWVAEEETEPSARVLEELDRRVADDDQFPSDVIPWSEVKASVRARLGR